MNAIPQRLPAIPVLKETQAAAALGWAAAAWTVLFALGFAGGAWLIARTSARGATADPFVLDAPERSASRRRAAGIAGFLRPFSFASPGRAAFAAGGGASSAGGPGRAPGSPHRTLQRPGRPEGEPASTRARAGSSAPSPRAGAARPELSAPARVPASKASASLPAAAAARRLPDASGAAPARGAEAAGAPSPGAASAAARTAARPSASVAPEAKAPFAGTAGALKYGPVAPSQGDFGETAAAASGADGARFVSEAGTPGAVVAGRTFELSVTFLNTGGSAWTAASGYRLGSQSPQDNVTWGMSRVWLGAEESIAPGELRVFTFPVTAPAAPGVYRLQWRMLREGAGWFGDATTDVSVTVLASGS